MVSLSTLQKFDSKPFIVIVKRPTSVVLYLANSSLIKKVSHSSKELRVDNIRGSINGTDILKEYGNIVNKVENFEELFAAHKNYTFEDNLCRLVEATNNIISHNSKYVPSANFKFESIVDRAVEFNESSDFRILKGELDQKLHKYSKLIIAAGFIDNIKIRGDVIEYLLCVDEDPDKTKFIEAIKAQSIPVYQLKNELGDYQKNFQKFHTQTDIKTKIMVINSNPKGYNIDKLLKYLDQPKTVFLLYFVGIMNDTQDIKGVLVSVFQEDIIKINTPHHWSGRSTRGTAQFYGDSIAKVIREDNIIINREKAIQLLRRLLLI